MEGGEKNHTLTFHCRDENYVRVCEREREREKERERGRRSICLHSTDV